MSAQTPGTLVGILKSAFLRKLTKLHDQITFSVLVFEENRKYESDSIFHELFENHIT